MPNDSGFVSAPPRGSVVDTALLGLAARQKTLPPRLFYDQEGCRLFYEITRLPEYYLTRTETALLSRFARDMLPASLSRGVLVEFGGSDEAKARYLLDVDSNDGPCFQSYVPIDIAAAALAEMRIRLSISYPALKMVPVVADFMQPLWLPDLGGDRFGFFPGSTIGNLDPVEAVGFLRHAREALGHHSSFLLGADLRKSPSVILPAYNDSAGLTAAFNLNMLTRLNREASANFDLAAFRHEAIWNEEHGRIEMYLASRHDQQVTVAGRAFDFKENEKIHTENSYKYTRSGLIDLARAAGWRYEAMWTDPENLFGLFSFRYE